MLSGAKNVAGTLQNDKLRHTLSVKLSASSRLNRVRIVFEWMTESLFAMAINLADEGRALQARAAATGKAWSPSVERRVDSTISVDVEEDRWRRRTSTSVDFWNVEIVLVGIVPVGIGTASHILEGKVTSPVSQYTLTVQLTLDIGGQTLVNIQ